MSNALPLFHLSPFDDVRSPLHQPHALATVEHEGTTWLLRPFRNLLFFKRADDMNGDAIFVLTRPLREIRMKPSQDTDRWGRTIVTRFEGETNSSSAVQLWKQCFPEGKWARFGVVQWEGGWDAVYDRDPVQFDLCFLSASGDSIGLTTDLSVQGGWSGYLSGNSDRLPENVSLKDRDYLRYHFIDLAVPKTNSGRSLSQLLLTVPLAELIGDFFADMQNSGYEEEWNEEDEAEEDEAEEDEAEEDEAEEDEAEEDEAEDEAPYDDDAEIRQSDTFPLQTELTFCGGSRAELETLLRCACYIQPLLAGNESEERKNITMMVCSTSIFDQARIESVCSGKVEWERPSNGRFDCFKEWESRGITLPPSSFVALCQIVLDHIEPVGDSYEMDHETCFRCFTSRIFRLQFPPPSSHDIIEASARLREWLQGRTSHEHIEELINPSSSAGKESNDEDILK